MPGPNELHDERLEADAAECDGENQGCDFLGNDVHIRSPYKDPW